MSVDYKYSISGDVTAKAVNSFTLHKDIDTNLTLANATFRGINVNGDILYVSFTQDIEASEKTSLDSIVQDHDSTLKNIYKTKNINFYPSVSIIGTTSYSTIGCFIYPGYKNSSKITAIDVLSYMDTGANSYDIQIVNRGDNTIIAEQNLTNTSMGMLSFATINDINIPEEQTPIEVLVKINKNGNANKNVHIDNIVFWLD